MDWQSLIQSTVFPITATCALAYVVRQIGIYFVEKVYEPTQKRHDQLVAKLESTLDTLQNSQMDLVTNMTRMVATMNNLETRLNNVASNQEKVVDLLDRLSQNIDELEARIRSVESNR